MTVLSARFAILACLCAAIPLTPSADAAHIYGGYLMEKHSSSPHSPQRSHNPSFSGGSATGLGHQDKNHGHRTHDHRVAELPPLLRRYHVHDHKKDHTHEGPDRHDKAHDKAHRSAFARSRYRQEPGPHSRRSSVYVPGEHGNTYLVSRMPPRNWGHGYADTDKESSHVYTRRQVDESDLAFGRIDIMSAQSSGGTQHLASLTVDSTPIDWTSGQTSAKAFPLNASTVNQTQFIMIPTDDSNAGGSSNKHVTLATEVFDASSAEMVMYCATYDPDPGQASALLMTPCTGTTRPVSPADDAADPCADEADASSSNPHQSQIFSYDPSSGKIEPVSATGNATGVGSSADTSTSCAGAKVRRDTGNSTTSTSSLARPSSTSTSVTPTASAFKQAQNVTLVYVAGALEVPAASPSLSAATTVTTATTTAKTGASIGQEAVFTTTITTTVVATVTTSGTPSATPARAAASVSTPSAVSTTTTQSSLSPSSSASTTVAPAKADESLEVEVVAVTPSTTAGASTTSAAASSTITTTATTTSHSSGTASPTLDAAAVASSVANQMPHRRRAVVIASASVSPAV